MLYIRKQLRRIILVTFFLASIAWLGFSRAQDEWWSTLAFQSTKQIAGVVGMSVGVDPNQFNALAQDLAQKEAELDMRAREMDQREQEIRAMVAEESAKNDRKLMVLIAAVTALLLFLIVLNFLLDQKRRRREGGHPASSQAPQGRIHPGEFTTKL